MLQVSQYKMILKIKCCLSTVCRFMLHQANLCISAPRIPNQAAQFPMGNISRHQVHCYHCFCFLQGFQPALSSTSFLSCLVFTSQSSLTLQISCNGHTGLGGLNDTRCNLTLCPLVGASGTTSNHTGDSRNLLLLFSSQKPKYEHFLTRTACFATGRTSLFQGDSFYY